MARLGRAVPFAPIFRRPLGDANVTVALTGVGATGAVGSFGSTRDVATSGNAGTGAVGSFGSSRDLGLSGTGGTGAAGSFGSTRDVALTGNGAAGAVGSFGAVPTVGLTGVGATGHVGGFGAVRGLETRQVAIVRLRESPFLFDERRWLRFSSFILDLETGLGLPTRIETD